MERSSAIVMKEQEYLDYINNHIKNIGISYLTLTKKVIDSGAYEKFMEDDMLAEIARRVQDHDESKYSDEEFDAYRKRYYPIDEDEKNSAKEELEIAWQHHYDCNDHHWNHWVDKDGNAKPMSIPAMIEMIIDWMAMGLKFSSPAPEWYEKNKNEIILHPDSRAYVERILNTYL